MTAKPLNIASTIIGAVQDVTKEWARQRKSEERFARIEAQLAELPNRIVQAVLDQLPRIKKEIGFKTPR